MFIYIFSPPFRGLPFGLDKMMLPLIWVYILLYRQAFFRFISVRYVKVFVILLAVTTGFLGLRFVMTPYDPKPPYNFALSLLLYIPFTFVWLNELTLRFKGNYLINDLMIYDTKERRTELIKKKKKNGAYIYNSTLH